MSLEALRGAQEAEAQTYRAHHAATQERKTAERRFLDEVVRPLFPDAGPLVLGGWNCSLSPEGHCVYDDQADPWHDDCLFCHDPSERK